MLGDKITQPKQPEEPKTTSNVVEALELENGTKTSQPPTTPEPMSNGKGGRPTVLTPETIRRLEEVFSLGGTDKEACFYAGIGQSTLYDYQKENSEFSERKEALKNKPILKARQTVVASLDKPESAMWYLERKRKQEFSTRVENTGGDGKDLFGPTLTEEERSKLDRLLLIKENHGNTENNPKEETA